MPEKDFRACRFISTAVLRFAAWIPAHLLARMGGFDWQRLITLRITGANGGGKPQHWPALEAQSQSPALWAGIVYWVDRPAAILVREEFYVISAAIW
jgi:hypothetical protein